MFAFPCILFALSPCVRYMCLRIRQQKGQQRLQVNCPLCMLAEGLHACPPYPSPQDSLP